MAEITWVIDSSSLMDIKSKTSHDLRVRLFPTLTAMAMGGRIRLPRQVVDEMKRGVQTRHRDEALDWVLACESRVCAIEPSLEDVKAVMAQVGDVVDHEKDAGENDADPYMLALALNVKRTGLDVRIVTEDRTDKAMKMSLATAAGILGIPRVPLAGFLRAEGIS